MLKVPVKVNLSEEDFAWFRELIANEAGIEISEKKFSFVYNRVMRRMQFLGITSFEDYRVYLEREDTRDNEIGKLLEEVVTHETSFFRYRPHLDFFREKIIPELRRKRLLKGLRVNILSAGCSSGEELYTLAMIVNEEISPELKLAVNMMGIDLSWPVIQRAENGVYIEQDLEGMPSDFITKYFIREGNTYKIIPQIKESVRFERFNLLKGKWHHYKYMDVIFCRNTLIYFSKGAKRKVLFKLVDSLRDEGYLVLGHTEIIDGEEYNLKRVTNTIYRKA